ncbi:hypothetical protein CORC01_13836 [Colletotrichum orchidophilum]|uniref:DUF952 domain-containing protein n=1 Tax=Colletotrichum orchidophilum TaxID=1209926 RepID=A0A1G4ANW6_9PEZI|nr:uncharacterized protein CORC01_13836 [Colletotrichum orchidophilum]OHE90859.1 hypothetical protein CORC01_13836 [Colletotrichum orchidophilum]
MSEPTQKPHYIYKIVPSAPPSPLPAEFPLSDLDRNDGFIHLSTAEQVLGTADLFFSAATSLWLLKLPYAALAEETRWEFPPSSTFPSAFPHLYGRNFGAADVADARGFERPDGAVWSEILRGDAWLV